MTLFSSGLAYFLYRLIFGQQSVPPSIKGFATLPIPILSDIPVLGPAVFNQFALVYMFHSQPAMAARNRFLAQCELPKAERPERG